MCKYCVALELKILEKEGNLRVGWMPQIGSDAGTFYYPVKTVKEAKSILDILAQYDLFQYEHNIKPDYSNAGGLEMFVR